MYVIGYITFGFEKTYHVTKNLRPFSKTKETALSLSQNA